MTTEAAPAKQPTDGPRVALFVTCLVDLFRPAVGFASLALLQRAGCEVYVPPAQTCCGQPGYNSGDYVSTRPLAQQVIAMLEPADYVVLPSGSCAGMLSQHYPDLLQGQWRERALQVAAKTFELTSFLWDVMHWQEQIDVDLPGGVAYHDSCAGLRELGIRQQPRALLQRNCNLQVRELEQRDTCCGFGGSFCARMPALSGKMADDKLEDALATEAELLTGGDLGCLLSLAGRATRNDQRIAMRHVAELLNGDLNEPPIGRGEQD